MCPLVGEGYAGRHFLAFVLAEEGRATGFIHVVTPDFCALLALTQEGATCICMGR